MRIVAEAGTCKGSIPYAFHAAVRAHEAGATHFKVQLYRKETLFTRDAPVYGKENINTADTQWDDAGELLPYGDWAKVKRLCDDLGIEFFASAWDFEAVNQLELLGVNLYKVASADITHRPLIEYIARTGKEIVLSTGAATVEEIAQALTWILKVNDKAKVTLLACTLSYPTLPEDANISRMLALKQHFPQFEVGYSDHTRTPETAWVVASMGGTMIEKHFTITPGDGGDHEFAVIPSELAHMTKAAGLASVLFGSPELGPTIAEESARLNARRSIAAAVDIPTGTPLTDHLLAYLRPGTGIPPYEVAKLLGENKSRPMRAMVAIPAGTLLEWKMVGYAGASLTVE